MPTIKEVLGLADECIDLAERAISRRDREALYRMAKAWLLVAEQAVSYGAPLDERGRHGRPN